MSEGTGPADGRQRGERDGDRVGGADAAGDDAALLAELTALRRRARTARHAYWFPLILFGLLTCASVPFYLQSDGPGYFQSVSGSAGLPSLPVLGGAAGSLTQPYLGYYWLAALLAGLLATLLWYRRSARRVGLATPARGYVVTVAVLTLLAVVVPLLSRLGGPLTWLRYLYVLWPGDLTIRGTFPFVIIAAGLWVLARAERSRGLAVIAAVYTASAVLASLYDLENVLFRLGWEPTAAQWRLAGLPNVLLPALVLLLAGTGAFAVQRHRRPPSAAAPGPAAPAPATPGPAAPAPATPGPAAPAPATPGPAAAAPETPGPAAATTGAA